MAVQTSYSVYHDEKYAGAVNSVNPYGTVSKFNDTGDTIPFGYGVVSDGEDGMALPTDSSTASNFIGITMRELNRAYEDSETFGAQDQRDGAVVTFGRVAGVLGGTVAKDDSVYMVIGDGTTPNTLLGTFTNSVGSGTSTAVAVSNAKFLEAGDAADAVWISLGIGG